MDVREGGAAELQAERLRRWKELEQQVEELADRLGLGIDEGIKEAVVALHAHGLETSQSCEGHDDHGEALPFVLVAAEEPDDRQENEEHKRQWQAENERLAGRLSELVEQWYAARAEQGESLDPGAHLELHPQGVFGAVRLESAAQERLTALPSADRARAAPDYRGEMTRFTEYLRERFLSGS